MVATPLLGGALVADVAAASVAAIGCAPIVSCVDQAITLSASGNGRLWPTLGSKVAEIFRRPVAFFTSAAFLWLWFVYAITYAAANTALTMSRALGISPTLPVLACSTVANMAASLAKDAAFARDGRRDAVDPELPQEPPQRVARRQRLRIDARTDVRWARAAHRWKAPVETVLTEYHLVCT